MGKLWFPIYSHNNNSLIKGYGPYVCGAIAHESISVICNYNNFQLNNNSQGIFGYGGIRSFLVLTSFSNFISNTPTSSLISYWGDIELNSIVFILNIYKIAERYNGILNLKNCYSDQQFFGFINSNLNSSIFNKNIFTYEIFNINACYFNRLNNSQNLWFHISLNFCKSTNSFFYPIFLNLYFLN